MSTNERDELAEIIDDRWHGYGYNPQGAADAILAAGYRRPRTITMTTSEFHAPDLTEVNAAMTKAFSHIQGLRMYSEAEIRDIKAQAFDDGFTSCASEHAKQAEEPSHPIARVNPYKATK